jgi:hypothetical protein
MPVPHYIHSGVNRPDLVSLLAEEHAAGMVTAQVVREPRLQWAFQRWPHVRLYLDSGFRRKMAVRDYVDLIERYGHRFTWIANLDCLFDQPASDEHYRLIMGRLSSPELRARILWVYQGGKRSELAAHAGERKLIGMGGCVLRVLREGVNATMRWLAEIGEILLHVGAQAHIFGVGNKAMLCWLATQPWVASSDSSKWLLAYKAHLLLLPTGQCVRVPELKQRVCAAMNIRAIESWMPGAVT